MHLLDKQLFDFLQVFWRNAKPKEVGAICILILFFYFTCTGGPQIAPGIYKPTIQNVNLFSVCPLNGPWESDQTSKTLVLLSGNVVKK